MSRNPMTKKQATQLGKALLRRMEGQGWKLRVWENLGWHYSVETKYLSVHEHLDRGVRYRFHCCSWGSVAWSSEPNKAVEKVLRDARVHLARRIETLANASKVYV